MYMLRCTAGRIGCKPHVPVIWEGALQRKLLSHVSIGLKGAELPDFSQLQGHAGEEIAAVGVLLEEAVEHEHACLAGAPCYK